VRNIAKKKNNAETRRAQSSEEESGEEECGEERMRRKAAPTCRRMEGRSAILSLSSAAAPLGAWFIAERRYRGGISDVDPHPARLNLEAQRWRLRSLWLNPALCSSPVYRRGAKSKERKFDSDLNASLGLRLRAFSHPHRIASG
jgi:hypothetical protein